MSEMLSSITLSHTQPGVHGRAWLKAIHNRSIQNSGGRSMWYKRGSACLFTTSEILGRAMLRVVQGRADSFTFESADINRIEA